MLILTVTVLSPVGVVTVTCVVVPMIDAGAVVTVVVVTSVSHICQQTANVVLYM